MKQSQIINATPSMDDITSGALPVPAPLPRFGKREWLQRTPAWTAFRTKILLPLPGGETAWPDGSPDLSDTERQADMVQAFLVHIGNANIIISVNSDGTRLMYDQADINRIAEEK